ncbi:T9SS type A sorting domain-containing protein [Hymenobacter aquaticus]|uniref:T9SS type A sorting domain-containing protein n=1 Tax=Hymenobacter aquaticus TaxID=1867101 RepID=A0A4Z0Q905_9BACT|nr:zinc-dependent metalloprotease family protein [Hymenobacter aquaticus]TGE25663.1 T9SS type A sorting domain-containing protein [Hymenobacter aquaticus]
MTSTFTNSWRTWRPALLGGLLWATVGTPHQAAAQRVLWANDSQAPAAARQTTAALRQYRPVSFQMDAVRDVLQKAPAEKGAGARGSSTVLSLPMPDGSSQRFRVVEVPVMHPALAAKYPSIKTYEAQGIDDPAATARLDVSPAGFHAMILGSQGRTVYIDPATPGDAEHHLVFERAAMTTAGSSFTCLTTDDQKAVGMPQPTVFQRQPNGTQLRTYRLALACTGEYAATKGGTKEGALAAMVTSVNRVSGVYEKEVAVRLVLIANTDQLIYLDAANDPYTNNSGSAMLNQNQRTISTIIGEANYDIGHVFSTGGGGVAQKPSVCLPTNAAYTQGKARGVTGSGNPTGDAFDIDYVAHEMGHQFGGDHTFNSNKGSCDGGNLSAVSAYEPGSGVTIMAYAGICSPQDLALNSVPYFHSRSFDQIVAHITGAGNCGVVTPTNNQPPVVNAGANYRIPVKTPFTLTGSATDPNSDPLTYSWEQYNLGPTGDPTQPAGDAPIFRFFTPTPVPSRTFPKIYNLITNTDTIGEILPTYGRRLIFRLVARDNRVGGGGVDYDSMNVVVVPTAGPFLVTFPNAALSTPLRWLAGTPQQVTWDVANTTAAPINAANVDIMLSTDGGRTFPTMLLANTPNDGKQQITVPASVASTTSARIKVQASGNIFFDISNSDFTIQAATAPTFFLTPTTASGDAPAICPGATATLNVAVGQLQGFTGAVALSAANLPTGVTVSYANNSVNVGGSTQATITTTSATPSGTYLISLVGTSGSVTQQQQFLITISPLASQAAAPITPTVAAKSTLRPRFTWSAVPNATGYEIEVATNATFTNVVLPLTSVTGTSYTPSLSLQPNTTYFWRVRGTSPCGTAPFSAATQFQTGVSVCQTIASTQVPRAIPAGAVRTVTSSVIVSTSDVVSDIKIRNLSITHPDVSELKLTLTNPQGRSVVLLANACPGTADVTLGFDDAAPAAISCPLNTGATVRPVGRLADLLNDPAATNISGEWKLTIEDNNPSNGGSLRSWSLELCTLGTVPPAPFSLQTLYNTYSNGTGKVDVLWAVDGSSNATSYEVERSFQNNTNFQRIATVPAPGTYYEDQVAVNGRYFYRVRSVNAIGASSYTNEANVLGNKSTTQLKGIQVYPNPSTGIFKVNVDNAQRGTMTLRVTDAMGRTVAAHTLTKGAALLQYDLDLSKLSTGIYQLHIDMPEGTSVQRLMKQ